MKIAVTEQDVFTIEADAAYLVLDPAGDIEPPHGAHVFPVYSTGSSVFSGVTDYVPSARGPGEYEVRGIRVKGIPSPGITSEDVNTIYLFEANGLRVYSLDFIDSTPNPRSMASFESADAVLVNVADHAQLPMDGSALVNFIRSLEPKIVVVNGWDKVSRMPSPALTALLHELGAKDNIETVPSLNLVGRGKSGEEPRDKIVVLAKPSA